MLTSPRLSERSCLKDITKVRTTRVTVCPLHKHAKTVLTHMHAHYKLLTFTHTQGKPEVTSPDSSTVNNERYEIKGMEAPW